MEASYTLAIYIPKEKLSKQEKIEEFPLVNTFVKDAGLVINHSFILAELLNIEYNSVMDIFDEINQVQNLSEQLDLNRSGKHYFFTEDIEIITSFLKGIHKNLMERFDDTNLPNLELQKILSTSIYFEKEANGQFYFKSGYLSLEAYMIKLKTIITVFETALKNGLWIEII